ncbi:MAG: hypothetical protein RR710_08725 [Oscillospiraceae bacterium]
MSLKKKILCGFMAVAMAFTATACTGKSNEKIVATYNDAEIPSGIYIYGMISSLNDAKSKLSDPKADVLTTEIDGVVGSEWIVNEAKKFVSQYVAVSEMFDELALKLTAKQLEQIDDTIESLSTEQNKDFGDSLLKNGIAFSSYESVLQNSEKISTMFPFYYGKDGVAPIPESELKAQYEKMYRSVAMMQISLADPSGKPFDETNKKAMQDAADDYFKRATQGESFAKIYADYELFTAQDKDTNPEEKTEEPEAFLIDSSNEYLPENFISELDKVKVGEYIKTEKDEFILIAKKHDVYEKPEDFENMTNAIISQLKSAEFNDIIKAKADEISEKIVYNENAIKVFSAKKIAAKNK